MDQIGRTRIRQMIWEKMQGGIYLSFSFQSESSFSGTELRDR